MHMIPVSSSNLRAVGYDPVSQTLRIQFHNGTYDYYNVPVSIHQGLMSAGSKGSYHAAYIKNAFSYRRV
ncbi:KTSC domain-containing protein [Aneurinibacillus danicus]|uniref:KTSC domain-containing protein n=2 Tax=Aneurinibacillus danicus TaxID=267746 RepID=A0A511VB98_9BACL|nr:KTSC domain-containing protein [Aneurinibacillus danicus]GEN36104.1 KTSC domain-containing protein [Aneurinibacillus danicus]